MLIRAPVLHEVNRPQVLEQVEIDDAAHARSLATSTILVQVIGQGTVTGSGGTINCGDGAATCYYTTSATSGSVTLTATPDATWTFTGWSGDCFGTSTCTLTLSGTDDEVTATFSATPSPGTSTLSVNVTGDSANNGGSVQGGSIDCGTRTAPPGSSSPSSSSPSCSRASMTAAPFAS